MNIGSLRNRIIIEKPTLTQNELGEETATWSTLQKLWAAIEPISAREASFARSFVSTVSHKITIRYFPDLSPTYRVKWGDRIFSIDGIVNVGERRIEMNLYCTEKRD